MNVEITGMVEFLTDQDSNICEIMESDINCRFKMDGIYIRVKYELDN